ncbi:MAG: ribbon-helix-helix protein, CopG family [Chloroflexota bacterium]|nr:ribbon-helix-helix protein, CopG family [Chloroflexota bacterium]
MNLQRTHILLDPNQKKTLEEIAKRHGRSVSDLTRELIEKGIEQLNRERELEIQKRLEALDQAHQVRELILREREDAPIEVDLVKVLREMREERDGTLLGRDR